MIINLGCISRCVCILTRRRAIISQLRQHLKSTASRASCPPLGTMPRRLRTKTPDPGSFAGAAASTSALELLAGSKRSVVLETYRQNVDSH